MAHEDPAAFWAAAAAELTWERKWDRVVNPQGHPRWFAGGKINTCYNALDRHVDAGHGARTALIAVSAMTGDQRTLTFEELRDEVAKVAGALIQSGVQTGDRVIIYMPMVAEAVFAMLACARIGAVHSVVFGGFAPAQLAQRITDAQPTVILTASVGLEPGRVVEYVDLVASACEQATHKPRTIVALQRPGYERKIPENWLDWTQWRDHAPPAGCVSLDADAPLYVLYTSGTTGKPKGIVRDHGGHAVALHWSMKNVYGASPASVFWAASDIGWVVGHSYIVYGPLLAGCATVLFEGKPVGTPDPGTFWRVIEQTRTNILFTAPTAIRAIRREDPDGQHLRKADLSSLQALFLAGERTDPETLAWSEDQLKVPVIDHWWQTELGWPALARCRALDSDRQSTGSAGRPVPGFDVQILDPSSKPLAPHKRGDIAIGLPLPPGATSELWADPQGFSKHYLATHTGYYTTGDTGYVDERGCVFVMGRTDDLINVAGHRLSTGAMEAAVATDSSVAECAVVGRSDPLKGQVPVALVVLKANVSTSPETLRQSVINAVREQIGPVAALKQVVVVNRLPKTRSGKVLRNTLRALANGDNAPVPATIDDPTILDDIRQALA